MASSHLSPRLAWFTATRSVAGAFFPLQTTSCVAEQVMRAAFLSSTMNLTSAREKALTLQSVVVDLTTPA